MWFYSHVIFLLRDQWLIETLSEKNGWCFGLQQLLKTNLANNIENFISHCEFVWNEIFNGMKRKVTRCCHIIKTLSTLKVSQYRKIGSMISSSKPVAACSDCRRLRNALCLCSPVLPAQAEQERCPKSLAVDFAYSEIARRQAGAQTWTQTWTITSEITALTVWSLNSF